MALIFLLVIPVLGVGLALVIRAARCRCSSRVFKKYDALNSSVQENIKGMRVVKSYVREEYEKQKFGAAAADVQPGLHASRAHPGLQQPAHAVLRVCGDGVRAVLRLLYGHHQPRP